MFLYCQPTTAINGNTTNLNSVYYTDGLKNLVQFPFYSNHYSVTGSPTTVGNNLTGNFTFTFNEEVIFDIATINTITGANKIVLKTINNTIIETLNFTTTTVSKKILFSIAEFQITDELINFSFLTSQFYERKIFNEAVGTEIINLFNPKITGAVATGTSITGTITMEFLYTILFSAKFTGTVNLYFENTLVYSGTTLYYPNPITKAVFTGDITELCYYCQKLPAPTTTLYTFIDYEKYEFTSSGTITLSGFTGTITFNKKTYVDQINLSSAGNITIDGDIYVTNSFSKGFYVTVLTVENLLSLKYEMIYHTEIVIEGFETHNFNSYTPGTINIKGITTSDQINTPAMYNGTGIIISQNANALSPLSGPGILYVKFDEQVYLRSITATGSGTVTINNKTYTIHNNTVNFHDWIHKDCILTSNFIINFSGVLMDMTYADKEKEEVYMPGNLIIENFETPTIEFPSTIFDTNISGPLGTPNTAYLGPGVGAGGSPGNGQNSTYLGGATQSNIVFDIPRYIESITFLNCEFGNYFKLVDNNSVTIKTLYIGNFGTNSVHKISIKVKDVKQIQLFGTQAITQLVYEADPREVIQIPDNSITPVNLTTQNTGNYKITVTGDTTSYITCSKSSGSPSIFIQSSPASTGQQIWAQWPSGSPVQIYHNPPKTGGTGNMLTYVVKY